MGNPFVHIELNTDDAAKAKKFYAKIFDWKIESMPGMDYLGINTGAVGGGMQTKMPGSPTQWLPYVEVASVKATLAKAKKAGANVVVDYMPIGVMGAIGVFVDPSGAGLGVWEKAAVAIAPESAPKKAASKKAAPKKAPAAAAKASPPARKASVPAAAPKKAAKKR